MSAAGPAWGREGELIVTMPCVQLCSCWTGERDGESLRGVVTVMVVVGRDEIGTLGLGSPLTVPPRLGCGPAVGAG